MSRIGKSPISIPEKVTFSFVDGTAHAKGPKGELSFHFGNKVNINTAAGVVTVSQSETYENAKAMWGTARTLVSNMITGVSVGFTKTLEFNGVGYKAAVAGDVVNLSLGFSHPIDYKLPEGITAKVNKNLIEITGCSKELVGFVAAKIRSFRPPEPYKGKGLKYSDEKIRRKAGKTGGKK
jgi:large subunit ribosomal protein L6